MTDFVVNKKDFRKKGSHNQHDSHTSYSKYKHLRNKPTSIVESESIEASVNSKPRSQFARRLVSSNTYRYEKKIDESVQHKADIASLLDAANNTSSNFVFKDEKEWYKSLDDEDIKSKETFSGGLFLDCDLLGRNLQNLSIEQRLNLSSDFKIISKIEFSNESKLETAETQVLSTLKEFAELEEQENLEFDFKPPPIESAPNKSVTVTKAKTMDKTEDDDLELLLSLEESTIKPKVPTTTVITKTAGSISTKVTSTIIEKKEDDFDKWLDDITS